MSRSNQLAILNQMSFLTFGDDLTLTISFFAQKKKRVSYSLTRFPLKN